MKWKLPPRIKIHEALGAVGDSRIEMSGNTAKVFSSSGNKFYTVQYDPKKYAIMSNDNGSYWKGYLGYPAIAYLMLIGKVPYAEECAQTLAGIHWKNINTTFKNDFDKTLAYIHTFLKKRKVDVANLEKEVDEIFAHISRNLPSVMGKKVKPPQE